MAALNQIRRVQTEMIVRQQHQNIAGKYNLNECSLLVFLAQYYPIGLPPLPNPSLPVNPLLQRQKWLENAQVQLNP
jgi:hypothetical protein